jgi:hypothetical protein
MKFHLLTVVLYLISFSTNAQFSSPESVEYDALNNRYIVSNTSSGQLLSLVPGSSPTVFTNNVSAPYGLAIVDSMVYVADNGDILGFNLITGVQTYTANINGGFLNGLCADTSGFLYVTDFSTKKIFKANRLTGTFNVFVSNTTKTPNGILYDPFNDRLVYGTWGSNAQVKAVSLVDSTETVLKTTSLSNIDGIVQDGQGRYYISVWGTQSIYRLDSAFANNPVQLITSLSSPADICYNLSNDTIAVPNTGNSTVQFYYVGSVSSIHQALSPAELKVITSLNSVTFKWNTAFENQTTLVINDISGKIILKEDVSDNTEFIFSTTNLKAGIYFARLSISNESCSFIVK